MHIDQVIPLVQEVSQTNQIESDFLFQNFKVRYIFNSVKYFQFERRLFR